MSKERIYSSRNSDLNEAVDDGDVSRQDTDEDHDVKEQIFGAIGNFGRFQLIKCISIIAVIWLPGSFHLLNMVFFRAETAYWCQPPTDFANWTVEEWTNISAPPLPAGQTWKYGNYDACKVYDVDYEKLYQESGGVAQKIKDNPDYIKAVKERQYRKCEDWGFDNSFWEITILEEWDLVCDKEYLAKLTQQITFFGLLCGAFFSGILSDKFGRVRTMMAMVVNTVVFGTISSFSAYYVYYEFFLFCIWSCGFSVIGFGTVGYCWMMEILTGKEKTIFGCAPNFNFAFWGLVTAGIAYLVPNWHHMQLIFSVPLLVLLCTYWVLPESPRWLITHNRYEEAEAILKDIAKYNGRTLPPDFKIQPHDHQTQEHHNKGKGVLGFLELFKTPNLRKKTLIIYYLWFSASIVYYGLTLNSNNLGASLFVYFSIGKVIEFPSIAIVTILVLKTGRRITTFLLFAACGVALLGTILIPTGYFAYEWPIVALNIFGRGASIGAMCVCYVYSAEIYPTVIRNVGIGSSSLWARISPMIAPYIADLAIYEPRLPIVIFGFIAIIACFLVTFLPETTYHKLPDTVQEGENLGKGDTLYSAIRTWFSNRRDPATLKGR